MIKNERGFSLIEVLIALAILGLVAVAFLSGLAIASKSIILADERTTAESLARSQMEYVKQQPYEFAPDGSQVTYSKISAGNIPPEYTICSISRAGTTVENTIYGVPWDSDPLVDQPVTADAGFQKIRLVIKHGSKEVFTFVDDNDNKITLEDYKVYR